MTEETADRTQKGGAGSATLSRELGEFLIQMSIAVHRFAMYPPGHPSLQPAAEGVMDRLEALMENRDSLAIGIAQDQLIIEGIATDEKHPVLRDLAKRLHEHQLGALSFDKGVRLWEIEDALATLAKDSEHLDRPLGLMPKDEIPDWDGLHLFGVGYSQLRIRDGEGGGGDDPAAAALSRATELWLGLARSAVASEDAFSGSGEEMPSGAEVARSIGGHRREAAYDQVIVGYLMKLTGELKDSGSAESEQVRQRVGQLIENLDESTLSNLVKMGGDHGQQKRFLLNAAESLAAESVVKVLNAAATGEGQNISNSLTRLMSKLAVHSDRGGGMVRQQATSALTEGIEELMDDWQLKDPNPDHYTLVLDSMSTAVPDISGRREMDTGGITGAQRIVEMALEIDAHGPIVQKAVSDVLVSGETGFLIDLLEEAPEDSDVGARIREQLTEPSQIRKLLQAERVDVEGLDRMVDGMGDAAFDPLLDVLTDSDSRAVRRSVFDVLAGRVDQVGQRVVERLEDSRWFVLRNLLALIQRFERLPDGFDPVRFLNHPDARVRREVFPLAIRTPGARDRALASALGDEDERMVRMALAEIGETVSEVLLPTLVNRVIRGSHPDDIKTLGVRALGNSKSGLALDTLVELVSDGTGFLGRAKLRDKSREMVAALRTLAQHWSDNERAAKVLAEAAKSKDTEISRASRPKDS